MILLRGLLGAVCGLPLSLGLDAQGVSVIPDLSRAGGLANASSDLPWNRAKASVRVQHIYDASEMPRFPITVRKIRFRPADFSSATWTGGTYGEVIVKMSTAAVAYNSLTSTFASNHGADKATVFNGSVTLTPGTGNGPKLPSVPYVTISLAGSGFKYDPGKGPFLIDIGSNGSKYTGGAAGSGTVANAVTFKTSNKVGQVYNLTDHRGMSGTVKAGVGLVIGLEYDFNGTFPDFVEDRTVGPVGTKVSFKDTTVTSSSSGVLSWDWDLNGDGRFGDSRIANPTYTYTSAGTYTVSMRVVTSHGQFTKTKTGLLTIATPRASVPDVIQYQFNEVRGSRVANTAVGTATAPAFGVVSNAGWHGDPGRTGYRGNEPGFGVLARSGTADTNRVDSKWPLRLGTTDSATITWWQRMVGTAPANAFGYVWGGAGAGFRCFNRGAAGNSATFRSAVISDLNVGVNLHHGNWIHLALVLDNTTGIAQWYVDGDPAASKSFTPSSFTAQNNGFTVGGHGISTHTAAVYYDMDDFRFYKRALSYAEILGTMAAENASTGEYGAGCSVLGSAPKIHATGSPRIGNAGFAIGLVGAQAGSPMALVIGVTAHVGGTFPLSLTPIIGCGGLEANTDLSVVLGTTSATGTHTMPMPVPNVTAIIGAHAYAQYGFTGSASAGVTRGLDINIQK